MSSRDLIRPDFRRYPLWTLAEAAIEAGVSIKTVSNWLASGSVARGFRHGPYRVDATSLIRFLHGDRDGSGARVR